MAVSTTIKPDLLPLIQLIGAYLFADDMDDFPKVDRIHHWQIGAALFGLPYILETGEKNG